MKFLIIIIFPIKLFAQTVFVHTGDISIENFNTKVKDLGGFSFIESTRSSLSLQNLDTFYVNSDPLILEQSIQKIQDLPLRKLDVEILSGLYQRKFESSNYLSPNMYEAKRVMGLFLMQKQLQEVAFDFWSQISSLVKEKIQYYRDADLSELQKILLFPESLLFIDGVEISQDNIQQISNLPHQWAFVSNTHYPIVIVGELSDFLNLFKSQKEFSADCHAQITPLEKDSFLKITVIGANNLCFSPSPTPRLSFFKKTDFKKIKWLGPAAFLIGALAAVELKDKKIVISVPSIRF